MTVLERPAGPDDKLVMQFRLVHDGGAPPPHFHPTATETFEVLEGEFEMLIGDEWRTVSSGEAVEVPPGKRHTFRNHSGDVVVIRNTHDPHHEFETYIRTIAAFSHEIKATRPNSPGAAVRMAMVWQRHSDLIRPTDASFKVLFPVMNTIGGLARIKLPDPAGSGG